LNRFQIKVIPSVFKFNKNSREMQAFFAIFSGFIVLIQGRSVF